MTESDTETPTAAAAARRQGLRARAAAWVQSLLVDHALLRMVWNNFYVVSPGRLYRAGHPTPWQLAAYAERHGIRTVISLRGVSQTGSDGLSRTAAARLGIDHVDSGMSSRFAPREDEVLRLIDIFAAMRAPALLHCKSGIDRSGFAAGVFLLVNGGSTRDALDQLSIRFGHLAHSRTGVLDAFFRLYATQAEGRKSFVDWLQQDYDRAELDRTFSPRGLAGFINDRVLARE